MRIIEKKFWPEYFDLFVSGKRKFELRLADFDVETGDIIVAKEWDPKTKAYTGRIKEFKIKKLERSAKNPLIFWPIDEIKEKGLWIMEFE